MPSSITLIDSEESSLSELLEGIAGFAIVEKATMQKAPGLRSISDVRNINAMLEVPPQFNTS